MTTKEITGTLKRHSNELLLLDVVEQEIDLRLSQLLHNHVLPTPSRVTHSAQVNRLWDILIEIGSEPATLIAPETSILEIFDRPEIGGKLLILGEPGAGKTSMMLELAKELTHKARQNPKEPIPVLLDLSSWSNSRQSIEDWLVTELKSKYGVRQDIGAKWLEQKLLLPMLDGLDEVKLEIQESCVIAINLWLQGDLYPISIVVCSRQQEDVNNQTQLNLSGVILLQALTDEQIQTYLSVIERPELWQFLQQNVDLLELVRTPLLLNITILSYEELAGQRWQGLKSSEQRIEVLLDAYIRSMFRRELNSRAYRNRKTPSAKQTKHWLGVLVRQMQRESQTEFQIEKMQPSLWLSEKQRELHRLITRLIAGLIAFLVAAVNGEYIAILIFRSDIIVFHVLIGVMVFHVLIGAMFLRMFLRSSAKLNQEIKLPNTFKLSYIRVWESMILGLMYSLLYGFGGLFVGLLVFGVYVVLLYLSIFVPIFFPIRYLVTLLFSIFLVPYGLVAFSVFGLLSGLISNVFFDLSKMISPEVDINRISSQGFWKSASNAVFIVIIFCLFLGLIFGLSFELIGIFHSYAFKIWVSNKNPNDWGLQTLGLNNGLAYGLGFGLTGGIIFGTLDWIQNFFLRLILFRSTSIPWDFARFLNYGTERLFLQHVGRRYRFTHGILRDRFAEIVS